MGPFALLLEVSNDAMNYKKKDSLIHDQVRICSIFDLYRYNYGTTNRIITNSKHAILKILICICSEDFSFNITIMNFLNFVIQQLSISLQIHQHSVGSYNYIIMSLIQFKTHMKSQKCRFVTKFKAAGRMCMLYYHVYSFKIIIFTNKMECFIKQFSAL